jgi:hypothetical protein
MRIIILGIKTISIRQRERGRDNYLVELVEKIFLQRLSERFSWEKSFAMFGILLGKGQCLGEGSEREKVSFPLVGLFGIWIPRLR